MAGDGPRADSETPEIVVADRIEAGPANRLVSLFDRDDPPFQPGDGLPPAWHWLMFLSAPRPSQLGPDGRAGSDGLLPPVDGLARMWAGCAMTFHAPLRIGEYAVRRSRLAAFDRKMGRSGPLVLASLAHEASGENGLCVSERTDLVFRPMTPYAAPAEGKRAVLTPTWRRTITPDEVLLFSFSALTFNAHRIHYDAPYAIRSEGYPALVVHGPLTCLLLLDLLRRSLPERALRSFTCRAQRALFCGRAVTLCGRASDNGRVSLWAEDSDGFVATSVEADLA